LAQNVGVVGYGLKGPQQRLGVPPASGGNGTTGLPTNAQRGEEGVVDGLDVLGTQDFGEAEGVVRVQSWRVVVVVVVVVLLLLLLHCGVCIYVGRRRRAAVGYGLARSSSSGEACSLSAPAPRRAVQPRACGVWCCRASLVEWRPSHQCLWRACVHLFIGSCVRFRIRPIRDLIAPVPLFVDRQKRT
jgi:hypothetical protein